MIYCVYSDSQVRRDLTNYLNEYSLLITYVLEIALQPPQHHPHINVSAVNAIVISQYTSSSVTSL